MIGISTPHRGPTRLPPIIWNQFRPSKHSPSRVSMSRSPYRMMTLVRLSSMLTTLWQTTLVARYHLIIPRSSLMPRSVPGPSPCNITPHSRRNDLQKLRQYGTILSRGTTIFNLCQHLSFSRLLSFLRPRVE